MTSEGNSEYCALNNRMKAEGGSAVREQRTLPDMAR